MQINKPICQVRGLIRPNVMCGHILVGGNHCGFSGECKHKSCANMIIDRVQEMSKEKK